MTRASRVPPAAQVTTTLVGLSQLRFRWDLLGPATREAIVAAVDGAAPGLNDREVRLAASPPLRPACPASVSVYVIPPTCALSRGQVCNLLHAFSKLGVQWTDFTPRVRAGLLDSVVRVQVH